MNRQKKTLSLLLAMAFLFISIPGYGQESEGEKSDSIAVNNPQYDLIFVIDNSGSMKKNDPQFITRDVVKNFAKVIPNGARLGMVLFDKDARLLTPLGQKADTGSMAELLQSLQKVDYKGKYTNSPDGIERAIYELKSNGRKDAEKAIIFITDGFVDTGDKQQDMIKEKWLREELSKESKNTEIRIFGIAFSENADVQLIQTLALKTGGEYFRALRASEIYGMFNKIIKIMNTQSTSEMIVMKEKKKETSTSPPEKIVMNSPIPETIVMNSPTPEKIVMEEKIMDTMPSPSPEAYHSPPSNISKSYYISFMAIVSLILMGIVIYLKFFRGPTSVPLKSYPDSGAASRYIPSDQDKPEAKLIDIQNVSSKGTLPLNLNKNRISIGRDSKNDIVIPHKTISSFHAIIEFKDDYYFLEDHRSTNGTSLNGKRLVRNQSVKLKSGDKIDFSSFEFRFILMDQDPFGKTVILGSSSMLPEGIDSVEKNTNKEMDDFQLFQDCLQKHLKRISDCGTEYTTFITNTFPDDVINTLSNKVTEVMTQRDKEDDGQSIVFTKFPILFQLCILPVDIENAAEWFEKKYGGYIKFLNQSFNMEYFSEQEFSGLCIVVYGRTDDAWISITIAPVEDGADQIEIMSYEFLSEEEKRTLALNFDEIGRIV